MINIVTIIIISVNVHS